MIARGRHLSTLETLLGRNPVVAILGARQAGKTTLARDLARRQSGTVTLFDLESETDLAYLTEPELALGQLEGLVVLDEIQRRPELFTTLRVLADRPGAPARFLVLGSASPDLLRQSSESLAGRIAYHRLRGFGLDEVGADNLDRLWLRGGFPRSYTADSLEESAAWRRDFIRTFLERDLPQLGVQVPSATLHRFWSMLAHYHGQTWNASELGRAFGVSHHTVRRYLDLLESTFVVRVLKPWSENLKKRQVKSPKVYIADSGILHSLLGLDTRDDLLRHPKVGASWEGFLCGLIIEQLGLHAEECFTWAAHTGAELDLLAVRGPRRYGFEFKRTAAPKVTPSMRSALEDLKLDGIDVIHAGPRSFPLAENIRAVAAARLLEDLQDLP